MIKKISTASNKRFLAILFMCFFVSTLAALEAYSISQKLNEKELNIALEHRLEDLKTDVKEHFERYNNGIISLRSAMYSVGVSQFKDVHMKAYYDSINFKKDYPGALGIGFIRWVEQDKLNAYITETNQTTLYPLTLHTLSDHQGDSFIIRYVLPYMSNKKAIGLDIASEQNRRIAALKAFNSNSTQLTEPITLVQDNNQSGYGFLILAPVYTDSTLLKQPYGWTYSPLIVSDVLQNLNLSDVSISLYEILQNTDQPFFSTMTPKNESSNIYTKGQLDLYGRTWEIHMFPKPIFYKKTISTNPIVNSLVTFLLIFAFLMLAYSITILFYQKKIILREINQLKAIFKSVPGTILVTDDKLNITSSNGTDIKTFEKDVLYGESIFKYIKKISDVSSLVIFNRVQNEMTPFSGRLTIDSTRSCDININPILNKTSFSGAIIYIQKVKPFLIDPNQLDFPIVLLNKNRTFIQENTIFTQDKSQLNLDSHAFVSQLTEQTSQFKLDNYKVISSYYKPYYLMLFIPNKNQECEVQVAPPSLSNTDISSLEQANAQTDYTHTTNSPLKETTTTDDMQKKYALTNEQKLFLEMLSQSGFELTQSEFNEALFRFLGSFTTYKDALLSFQDEMLIALSHFNNINESTLKGLHAIKGGFATFGFSYFAEQAKSLEICLKNTEKGALPDIEIDLKRFKTQCYEFNEALKQYFDRLNEQPDITPTDATMLDKDMDLIEELMLLLQLVEHCNLSALDKYESIEKSLETLPFPEVSELKHAMRKINFDEAEKAINLIIEKSS